MNTNTSSQTVVLIPGDGIGPEVTVAVKRVLEKAGSEIQWVEHHAGIAALEQDKDVLPEETTDAILEHGLALKGPCTTPVGKGFSSVNVQMRKKLHLYAAVRPVRSLPGIKTRYEDVDLVIIRENTEGLYSGVENEITPGTVMSMKVATQKGCTRIADYAFDYCQKRGRKKVTAFHKANIMKLTDGLFLNCAQKVHDEKYPDVVYDSLIIDAACMRLVQNPGQFDMLLMENLYGDVVSDLCAGLVGGLGVVPGANIGIEHAVFEAVHGSAPDIAGKGIANPLALLMSSVMMLNHLSTTRGCTNSKQTAQKIKLAYNQALADGCKTGDLGGNLSTEQFADAIIQRLNG